MTANGPATNPLPARLQAIGWSRELFVRGPLTDPEHSIAIVGARAATVAAMDRAHAVARHVASRGVHVVSGGALGIDGAAHRGALAAQATTTVVLGTGVDVLYPERHAPLFHQVLAAGGTLVSMFPSGSLPRKSTFPQRNRLIAALADLVLVVEADTRSGSLSTAHAARKLGRTVAAFAGSRGCAELIANGAQPVSSPEDVLAALHGRAVPTVNAPVIDDPITAQVRAAIAAGCVSFDAIVRTTGLAARAVLRVLPLIEQTSTRGKL